MTPLFINSAFVLTRERLILRGGRWNSRIALPVRFGVMARPEGIILIDAGYSSEAISAAGRSWGLRAYAHALAPHLMPDGDPTTALLRLGYRAQDVTAVIVTHFHADHVSALTRFPQARLIAHAPSYQRVMHRKTLANGRRGIFPELLPADMAARLEDISALSVVDAPLGLGPGWDIFGDGSVLGIDLPGHAEGHFGLCFPLVTPPLLYATDVQWLVAVLSDRRPGFAARLISENDGKAAESTVRVARFAAAGGTVMLCHDPVRTIHDDWGPE